MPSGIYIRAEEHNKNFGLSRKGKHHSEEAKRKISLALKGRRLSEETRKKMGLSKLGKSSPRWKGGKYLDNGYIFILKPKHPFANKYGYMLEHRLIMEQKLGRYLTKEEPVHHIDGNRSNNNLDNLYLFKSNSEHIKYHCFLRNCIKGFLNEQTRI